MADKKISALTGATTPLAGTEVLPIVQGGATVKVSVADLTVGRAVGSAGGTFTDNFVQGTAAKGVNFTANTPAAGMTSQLLNWYEEGTWTPSVYDAVTGGNKSATNGSGTYTRIGRQVTARFTLDSISTVGLTAGNAMSVGNLPFTAVGDTMGSFYTYRVGGGTAQSASLVVSSGTARLRIFLYSGNSATTDVLIKISDLVSGTSGVYGTITYFV